MKFSELSVGEQFKLHRRGTLLTKTGSKTFVTPEGNDQRITPETEVLTPDGISIRLSTPPATTNPFGARNKVDFQEGYVRMDGAFTEVQLEAVLARLRQK